MNRHEATVLLDRVAEGQAVATWRVMLALRLTGDISAGAARREHPADRREGPAVPREQRPRSLCADMRDGAHYAMLEAAP